jgi:hypothetical protein
MFAAQTESAHAALPLALTGACGCAVENDRVVITIAEIANRRDLGNLSGTLAIELWALERPYSGGGFTGTPLCGTSIGELGGQRVLTDCRYDLILQLPPPGTWFLALMLREWTAAGYLTRDYVNFTLPYVVEPIAPVLRGGTDTVIDIGLAGNPSAAAVPAEPQATPPRAGATPDAAPAQSPPEPPPDPAISLQSANAREPVAVESIGAKLFRMVRRIVKP